MAKFSINILKYKYIKGLISYIVITWIYNDIHSQYGAYISFFSLSAFYLRHNQLFLRVLAKIVFFV